MGHSPFRKHKTIYMIPRITVEDGQAKVEGNYEFKRGEHLFYDPMVGEPPYFELTFKHSPEKPESMSTHQAAEILGERLKQDFIATALSDASFKK